MSLQERRVRAPQEKSALSEADFIDFLDQQRRRFIRREHLAENLEKAFNRFRVKQIRRRSLLKAAAGVFTGIALGDQIVRVPEFINPEPPKIVFPQDQQDLLKKSQVDSKTAVIFFGAATVRDPSKFPAFEKFLSPFNESDFPVGYMQYANYGLDPKRTAEELKRLKTEHGIENVIGIFQSAGLQFMAEAFDQVGGDIKLLHGVLDSTPLDASTTDYPMLGPLAQTIDPFYDGGGIMPAIANVNTYGKPIRGGTAGPGLAFDQAVALADGEYLTSLYVPRIQRDGTTFSYVTTEKSENDKVINPVTSLQGLQRTLGVQITRYGLLGHQSHANAHENPQEYQRVSRIIAKLQRSRLTLAA